MELTPRDPFMEAIDTPTDEKGFAAERRMFDTNLKRWSSWESINGLFGGTGRPFTTQAMAEDVILKLADRLDTLEKEGATLPPYEFRIRVVTHTTVCTWTRGTP